MRKVRVDLLLVERGLAETRASAQRLVMAGQVRADGQLVHKPSTQVAPDAQVELIPGPRFVSRGGEKLDAALEFFQYVVSGRVCADVGASTGGFTDCLLQRGAARVYAIDVGSGQLHWRLRQDDRVVVLERQNVRHLKTLPEPVGLVTMDLSFISVTRALPRLPAWYPPGGGDALVLIKPQFEAGRAEASRGRGVIRDPNVHRAVLRQVLQAAHSQGYGLAGLCLSSLPGPKGNREFFAYLQYPQVGIVDLKQMIESALAEAGP